MKIDSAGKTGRLGRGDYWGGTLMMVIGLWAAYAGTTYDIGTLQRMGPGFFPVALGVILTLVGAGIALTPGNRIATPGGIWGRLPEPRAWILILGSIAAFVVVGRYGGLLPATAAVVFISAFADRKNSLLNAVLLTAAMILICVVVFWWALKLQFPLFQWG
jgi:hypothetical protein